MTATPLPPVEVPTSDDVATLLRARTKDLTGAELGIFTGDTRPTDSEVTRIIAMVYDEVTAESGMYLAARCAGLCKATVTIGAAARVELSYFPEQVRSDRSVYTELIEQYNAGRLRLMECVTGNLPPDGGDTPGDDMLALRFGMLDVHGWTSVPGPYGVPPLPPDPEPA